MDHITIEAFSTTFKETSAMFRSLLVFTCVCTTLSYALPKVSAAQDIDCRVKLITVEAPKSHSHTSTRFSPEGVKPSMIYPKWDVCELSRDATTAKTTIEVDIKLTEIGGLALPGGPVANPVTVVQASLHHVINHEIQKDPVMLTVEQDKDNLLMWRINIPAKALKPNQIYYVDFSGHKKDICSMTHRIKILVE